MTHRERFETVLRGGVPDRVPMVTRLDIWYEARRAEGRLPQEVAGCTVAEIEERLGMGRSARFARFHREIREEGEETVHQEGDRIVRQLDVGGRRLVEVRRRTEEQRLAGMRGRIEEHLLKSAADYRAMARAWERTCFEADHAALATFDAEVGQAGFPLLIFGASPIHRIMLEYAGYEAFYCHLTDFPREVRALQEVMEARYEAFWPELASARATMVLHGAHWNGQMTPRPLFERLFRPYLERFGEAIHRAGKRWVVHADADLTGLADLLPDIGVDVADCLACAPLVPFSLAAARRMWGERVIVWGGFASTLLGPTSSDGEFLRALEGYCEGIADGRAVIVGVSDNVMPDALWPRLRALAERVAALRPAEGRSGLGKAG